MTENSHIIEPTLRRYVLPNVNGEGYGTFVLSSDGYFSAVSDYGNYAYQWTSIGQGDFREFLIRIGDDYLISKIAPQRSYDSKATRENILALIEKDHEDCYLDDEEEAKERKLLADSDIENELGFSKWFEATTLTSTPTEIFATSHCSDAVNFCERLFPRLKELLRAELAEESDGGNPRRMPR